MTAAAIIMPAAQHLARQINAAVTKGDGYYREAGTNLAALKKQKPPGISWGDYLRDCGVKLSQQRADQLIRWAKIDGRAEEDLAKDGKRKAESKDSSIGIPVEPTVDSAEASAEARKAEFAALDEAEDKDAPDADGDQTKQPPRAEVAKLVRAWVKASPEAKREFVRERWDEIARTRKQLEANGAHHEDRWIESETLPGREATP